MPEPPLPTVSAVDLERYMGKWYEIARYTRRFQKGCVESTTTYRRISETEIEMVNGCIKDGTPDRAVGKAWVPDPNEPGKPKASCSWPFRGDYWIIDLDEDYRYAVVSAPSREYRWILSRSWQLDEKTLELILQRLRSLEFDLSKLRHEIAP